MSAELCLEVVEYSRSTGVRFLVLYTMADNTSDDRITRVYLDWLAPRCHLTIKQTLRAIEALIRMGELIVIEHPTPEYPRFYRLKIADLAMGRPLLPRNDNPWFYAKHEPEGK